MEFLIAVGLILAAYGVGGIPFCLILGKVAVGKDLRQLGDHNPGAWNLMFNANLLWGVTGALLDAGKGAFAFWLGLRFGGPLVGYLAAVAAVAGAQLVAISPLFRWQGRSGNARGVGCNLSLGLDRLCIPGHRPPPCDSSNGSRYLGSFAGILAIPDRLESRSGKPHLFRYIVDGNGTKIPD